MNSKEFWIILTNSPPTLCCYSANMTAVYSKPLCTARMRAAEQAAIRQVRQLFDKHDKYANRNRHDLTWTGRECRSTANVSCAKSNVSCSAQSFSSSRGHVPKSRRSRLYRQMRISHRWIVASFCFGNGLLEPARQEVRCTARNASP